MTDTNNTDGAALLPVTAETFAHHRDLIDDEALDRLRDGVKNSGGHVTVQCINFNTLRRLIARLDVAEARQSNSLPGDVGMREALKEAYDFIASQFRDPSLEADGEWLDKEARPIIEKIATALPPHKGAGE